MRCSMCGHESPPGSLFCLNCGSQLAPLAGMGAPGPQTPGAGQGLPQPCPTCRAENPPGMKFCRQCGTVLAPAQPGLAPTPVMGGPGGPMGGPPPGAGGPPPGMGGRDPAFVSGPPPGGPVGGPPPPGGPMGGPPPPMGGPPPPMGGPGAGTTICPRCGASTPAGFAFCQQCGMKLGGAPPAPVDAYGGTLAASGPEAQAVRAGVIGAPPPGPAPAARPPAPAPAPAPGGQAWGVAVSVNRDGSDGERFPLAAEYVVFGRAGADVAFDADRFLAREHARLERKPDGARIVPVDEVNGIFRKLDGPVELDDGTIILLGREVLRYESVDAEERSPEALVRHGVALFGSPPREPWGRLMQLLPSGGVRDVRHLADDDVTLGREEGDIVFSDDAFMSRRHAQIVWDGKRAVLSDLGSSNGSFVRLDRAEPGQERRSPAHGRSAVPHRARAVAPRRCHGGRSRSSSSRSVRATSATSATATRTRSRSATSTRRAVGRRRRGPARRAARPAAGGLRRHGRRVGRRGRGRAGDADPVARAARVAGDRRSRGLRPAPPPRGPGRQPAGLRRGPARGRAARHGHDPVGGGARRRPAGDRAGRRLAGLPPALGRPGPADPRPVAGLGSGRRRPADPGRGGGLGRRRARSCRRSASGPTSSRRCRGPISGAAIAC